MIQRSRTIILMLLLLISFATVANAEEARSVYDAIEKEQGQLDYIQQSENPSSEQNESQSSIFSTFIRFVVSLTFIILLIYITLKFWSDRTRGMQARGPFLMLGGCALGANRSLQAVMIGKTIYILGVGEDVRLIREISEGDEYDLIINQFENQTGQGGWRDASSWFNKRTSQSNEKEWEEELQDQLLAMEEKQAADTDEWTAQLKKEGRWK